MPRGKNKETVARVFKVLTEHPDGLTISQLAYKCKVPYTTLLYYVNCGYFSMFAEDNAVGPAGRPFVRYIVLKPGMLSKKALLLNKIMKEMDS